MVSGCSEACLTRLGSGYKMAKRGPIARGFTRRAAADIDSGSRAGNLGATGESIAARP
jgi:hypothetical protein